MARRIRRRRRRRELDDHVPRMDAERLVKISKDNIPAGITFSGRPKKKNIERVYPRLKRGRISYNNNKEGEEEGENN